MSDDKHKDEGVSLGSIACGLVLLGLGYVAINKAQEGVVPPPEPPPEVAAALLAPTPARAPTTTVRASFADGKPSVQVATPAPTTQSPTPTDTPAIEPAPVSHPTFDALVARCRAQHDGLDWSDSSRSYWSLNDCRRWAKSRMAENV